MFNNNLTFHDCKFGFSTSLRCTPGMERPPIVGGNTNFTIIKKERKQNNRKSPPAAKQGLIMSRFFFLSGVLMRLA